MNKDRLSKARRSWNMSRIRGKHTAPELRVRSLLHRLGFRFRLHSRILISPSPPSGERVGVRGQSVSNARIPISGPLSSSKHVPTRSVSVDILLPKHKTAIFIHGCFWHRHKGCKNCTTPTNRREWWLKKLNGNATRDKINQRALRKLGWRTIVIWECETEKTLRLEKKLVSIPWIGRRRF